MIDVGKSPCRFKLQIRARITKAWLVKNKEINQTLRLLADMTEELYHLWYSIDEDAHGWIAFSTEDFTGSTGCSDFLIPNVDT
jgi:hypothetical protein